MSEKISGREVVELLIVVFAIGCITYAADQYIYQPCGISFSRNMDFAKIANFALFGIAIAVYLLIRRIRWFANHNGMSIIFTIITVPVSAALVVRFWCLSA